MPMILWERSLWERSEDNELQTRLAYLVRPLCQETHSLL